MNSEETKPQTSFEADSEGVELDCSLVKYLVYRPRIVVHGPLIQSSHTHRRQRRGVCPAITASVHLEGKLNTLNLRFS